MRAALVAAAAFVALGGCAGTPRGYYPDPWSAAYAYRYEPPIAYGPYGDERPFAYVNGYDGYNIPAVIPETAQPPSGAREKSPPSSEGFSR